VLLDRGNEKAPAGVIQPGLGVSEQNQCGIW